jgi:hypothetical protein
MNMKNFLWFLSFLAFLISLFFAPFAYSLVGFIVLWILIEFMSRKVFPPIQIQHEIRNVVLSDKGVRVVVSDQNLFGDYRYFLNAYPSPKAKDVTIRVVDGKMILTKS